jgi:hypothetical protein
VARAKHTDRAEARRRARAAAGDPSSGSVGATAGSGSGSATGSRSGGATAGGEAGSAAGSRPSVLGAFRGAVRPIDLRGDIRRIPWLITRTNSVWLPSLLVVGSAIWYASSTGAGSLQNFAFQLFVYPPPQIGALFLAGILTDRMSYMAGGIVGLVCGIVFTIYLAVGPIPAGVILGTQREAFMLYGLILSPLSGLAIGGFAGFYRRFLRRANPNAGRRQPPAKGKGTKAPARR